MRKPERKACLRRTKKTLKKVERAGDDEFPDRLTTAWIVSRCNNCGACPKLVAKLPTIVLEA